MNKRMKKKKRMSQELLMLQMLVKRLETILSCMEEDDDTIMEFPTDEETLIRKIIAYRERDKRELVWLQTKGEENSLAAEILRGHLVDYEFDLLAVGISIKAGKVGDSIDPMCHMTEKVEATNDPALHHTIAKVFTDAYYRGDRCMEPMRIHSYQLKE